ncbi:hypothetical protein GOP47_0027190 [Adiantum capillus-veneris]|nr:hypothetical protein GOP47_0027190 [Adiantum capillus-veneris]
MTRKRIRDEASNAQVISSDKGGDHEEEEESGASIEERLEVKILDILQRRAASSTMCPSEAARAVSATNWRPLMDRTRQVACRMASQGRILITQKGVVCNPLSDFRGPIRLKLAST